MARCSQWWHGATSLSQDSMAPTAESIFVHELRDVWAPASSASSNGLDESCRLCMTDENVEWGEERRRGRRTSHSRGSAAES